MDSHIEATDEARHSRGLFGLLDGIEVPFLGYSRAGVFGVAVEYVAANRADVAHSYPGLEGTTPPPAGVVRVPASAVTDLTQWDWFVVVDGVRQMVLDVRGPQFLIGTGDSRVAALSDDWDGSEREGWYRFVDADGLDVTVEHHPLIR